MHEVCEKSLTASSLGEIQYFDDEELDAYRGKASSEYTAEEVEEFSFVLYTMREDEVEDWLRSLRLRGVELPDELKDEALMIIGERLQ